MSTPAPLALPGRRQFLGMLAASTWPRVVWSAQPAQSGKPLRGIFPIMQTAFTQEGALDIQTLQREAEFLDRCGAHGMVWPQFASEYASLSHPERLAGSEVIASAAKRLRPAAVIGVQAQETEEEEVQK